jgi:hypothetical protein
VQGQYQRPGHHTELGNRPCRAESAARAPARLAERFEIRAPPTPASTSYGNDFLARAPFVNDARSGHALQRWQCRSAGTSSCNCDAADDRVELARRPRGPLARGCSAHRGTGVLRAGELGEVLVALGSTLGVFLHHLLEEAGDVIEAAVARVA